MSMQRSQEANLIKSSSIQELALPDSFSQALSQAIENSPWPSTTLPGLTKNVYLCAAEPAQSKGSYQVAFPEGVPAEIKKEYLDVATAVRNLAFTADPVLAKALQNAQITLIPVDSMKEWAAEQLKELPADAPALVRAYYQAMASGKIVTDSGYAKVKNEDGTIGHHIYVEMATWAAGLAPLLSAVANEMQHARMQIEETKETGPAEREIAGFKLSINLLREVKKLFEPQIKNSNDPVLEKFGRDLDKAIEQDQKRLESWQKLLPKKAEAPK